MASKKEIAAQDHTEAAGTPVPEKQGQIQTLAEEAQVGLVEIKLSWRSWVSFSARPFARHLTCAPG